MKAEHPFQSHKAQFKEVPKEKRSQYNIKMLETPQLKGQYKIFKEDYPNSDTWEYKGYKMHYHFFKNTEEEPKAILFYFHGMNAHSGSSAYTTINIAKKLNLHVYAQDFMNFGRSQGNFRGLIQSFDDLIGQAEGFVDFIMNKYQNKDKIKIYISGLSLGGSICFRLCLRNPERYSGVMFFSPALRENKESQPYMKKLGKVFGALFPRGTIFPQSFNSQSRIDQTDRIMADPYIYKDKVVPGSVKVILQTMAEIQTEFSKFKNPFILIQSGVDKMVDPFLAIDFEQQCQSQDKTVIYCKDMWHAVFGEEQIEHIVPILTSWLGERV